ncbi:hypothetical protein REPUB_Repub09cG0107600 [Reevesia pubescens]
MDILKKLFSDQEAKTIAKIFIGPHESDNKIIWHFSKNGIYNVKSGYFFLQARDLNFVDEGCSERAELNDDFWKWIRSKPPDDTIKINCDASFDPSSGKARIVAIARDSFGRMIDIINALVRTSSSLAAEAMALGLSSTLMARRRWNKSILKTDCEEIICRLNNAGLAERPWKVADARLALEDGSIWKAKSFGASGTQVGEVVFNTSLTGYQEILADPSYAGQFVLMTNPHIGNTGVNFDDEESRQCFLTGLVIRSLSITFAVLQIGDVRKPLIEARWKSFGVLSTEESRSDEELLEMSRSWDIVGIDLISGVTCNAPYEWVDKTKSEWDFNTNGRDWETYRVKLSNSTASYGCKITVVPSTWPAAETLKLKPDGVLFSNGPGDPSAVPYAVETVKEILGKVSVFGICMVHQLLGQALGGKTFKMKFGHHGGNHPVRNIRSGHVEISAQNHNYAVDPASLPEGLEATHINLNDGSCAGLAAAYPALNIMSLQYHPEASPGPHDSDCAFREFIKLMKSTKQAA